MSFCWVVLAYPLSHPQQHFSSNRVTLAQVRQVVRGGPAFEEGTLQAGDVVVAVNGCVVAGAWPGNHSPKLLLRDSCAPKC